MFNFTHDSIASFVSKKMRVGITAQPPMLLHAGSAAWASPELRCGEAFPAWCVGPLGPLPNWPDHTRIGTPRPSSHRGRSLVQARRALDGAPLARFEVRSRMAGAHERRPASADLRSSPRLQTDLRAWRVRCRERRLSGAHRLQPSPAEVPAVAAPAHRARCRRSLRSLDRSRGRTALPSGSPPCRCTRTHRPERAAGQSGPDRRASRSRTSPRG